MFNVPWWTHRVKKCNCLDGKLNDSTVTDELGYDAHDASDSGNYYFL